MKLLKNSIALGGLALATSISASPVLTGCSDNDPSESTTTKNDSNGEEDDADKEWFVVSTQVYGDVTTSYLPIVSSLDVKKIDIENAKELNGRS